MAAKVQAPRIDRGVFHGRRSLSLSNEKVRMSLVPGGGHIVELVRKDADSANPYFVPPWRGMEPSAYRAARHERLYGGAPEARLLASLMGHNLCLDLFGGPSEAEARCGLSVHGEAPVATWKVVRRQVTARAARLVYRARLPVAAIEVTRQVVLAAGADGFRVRETVRNLGKEDRPIMWTQHVTLGPPFLEPGVTMVDLPARWGQVYPDEFGRRPRLKRGATFRWPDGPGIRGNRVDLRPAMPDRVSGDFFTQQFDPKLEWAWFTAVNPKRGLLFGNVFRRSDFPWIGIWEESRDRKGPPWKGRTYCRGLEYGTTPFPMTRRRIVEMGSLHGQPSYRWIGARETIVAEYYSFLIPVEGDVSGVRSVDVRGRRIVVHPAGGGAPRIARV